MIEKKIKVALIWPKGGDIKMGMPLWIGYLVGNSNKEKYDFHIVDCTLNDMDSDSEVFLNIIKSINPTIVGVSSWSFNFSEALKIIKKVKDINNNVKTIYGGPHATAYAKSVIENEAIDFVFRGEADIYFNKFLDEFNSESPDWSKIKGLVYRDREKGKIFNEISFVEYLDDIKFPDYDALNLPSYIEKGYNALNTKERCAPIFATRGCPYKCKFCAVPVISSREIRSHSVEYLMECIKLLYTKYDIRGFNVIDDNFTFYPEFAKDFCKNVIKLNYKDIELYAPNAVRMQRGDFELWTLMRQAGWKMVTVAPESGSKEVLKKMRKGLDPEKVPGIVREIRRAGLKVHGFILLGYPGETIADLKKTELLVRNCKFDHLSVSTFQPIPGTPIYDELLENGEITKDTLPTRFGDRTKKAYVTPALKDFNFNRFVKKLELIMYLNNPKVFLKYLLRVPGNIFHRLRAKQVTY